MTLVVTAKERLRKASLKVTNCRTEVLIQFYRNNFALDYAQIDVLLEHKQDKATVYRTLKAFTENGIIHEIRDSDKSTKYALCKGKCKKDHHYDTHAHFKCTHCMNIFCLDHPVIDIDIPKNYIVHKYNLTVEGTCIDCSNHSS